MLGAFAAAIALSSASPARAQGAPTTRNGTLPHLAGAAPDGPSRCAFPFIVDADNLNLASPDPNATYWAMPFTLGAGDSMLVHGTYPSARFMAYGGNHLGYNIYTSAGYATVWGDGTSGSSSQSYASLLALGSISYTAWGRLPAGQYVRAGSYDDQITVVVSY